MHNLTWLYAVIVVTTILTGCNQAQSPTADSDSGWLSGTIIGAMSTPLSGVIVTTSPSSDTAITDSNGRFVLHAPTGVYTVLASKGTTSTQAFYTVLSNDTVQANLRLPVWKLAWNDEFDEKSINTTLWKADDQSSGLQDLQYFAPDDAYTESGILHLRIQQRNFHGFPYTTGQLTGQLEITYGRVEIRAKLPQGKGIVAAHWLWSFAPPGGAQEIDIMEMLGHLPNNLYTTYHFTDDQGVKGKRSRIHSGPDYTADFHIYSVEWYPEEIIWYIDGDVVYKTSTIGQPLPLRLILSSYVGGDWAGSPDATTSFPQYHDIDYVRVYKAAE